MRNMLSKPVIVFGLIAFFFEVFQPLSLFVFIPLMMVYYLHGVKIFSRTAVFFLLSTTVWAYINFVSKNTAAEPSIYTLESFNSIEPQLFIFNLLYSVGSIVAVYILLVTRLDWTVRLFLATTLIFISTFLQARSIQVILPELLKAPELLQILKQFTPLVESQPELGTAAADSIATANQALAKTLQDSFAIAVFFSWIFMVLLLILNWLITVFFLQKKLKFTMHMYLLHIYTRVLQTKASKLTTFGICNVLLLVFFSNLPNSPFVNTLQYVFGNISIMCIFCYFIYGFVSGYFYVSNKMKILIKERLQRMNRDAIPNISGLRTDVYLLLVGTALLIPFVNGIIVVLFVLNGIRKNIKDNIRLKIDQK